MSRTKDERITMRVSQHQKEVLMRAATVRKTSVTNFLLEHGYQAAQEVLAEEPVYLLGNKAWDKFCEALDKPARRLPALRKLLTESSVLDG